MNKKVSIDKKTGETVVEITPILDNPAVSIQLENKLYRLKKKMVRDYRDAIKEIYARYDSYLVTDADNIIDFINDIINGIGATWANIFEEVSEPFATFATERVADRTQRQYRALSFDNPFLIDIDVDYENNRTRIIKSSIAEQVGLIKSIPTKFHDEILGDVMRNTAIGGNAQELFLQLRKLSNETDDRLKFIANDQIMKAAVLLDQQEAEAAGFTTGVWKKSIAGKTHRKSHAEANGTEFELSKGCLIDGEYILPRIKPHCKCTYKLIKTSRNYKT